MIRTIEELSMNAWPAMRTLHYDGWVLRSADGYTKRANSVYPLYSSEQDVDAKIEFCESFYRDLNLPTVFKLTRVSIPLSWMCAWKNTATVLIHRPACKSWI